MPWQVSSQGLIQKKKVGLGDNSLCCISDILARQSGCTVDGEDYAVSCREVLRERAGAQARVARDVDEVKRRVQVGRVALRAVNGRRWSANMMIY